MCGRYSLTSPPEAVRQLFQFEVLANFPARYNIAPTQDVPVVRPSAGGGRELTAMRWGLVPGWAKKIRTDSPLINARIETVTEKPAFRTAVQRRRCLVPADGFYEWKLGAGAKQPYRITLAEGGVFAFAGIWEHWLSPGGDELESMAILTTEANTQLGPLHSRMPVIVDNEDHEMWLDTGGWPADRALEKLRPSGNDAFDFYPVSRHVNNVRNDDSQCIEPQSDEPRLL